MSGPAGRVLVPEGGALDQLDKALSRPIFHCRLPAALEVLLSMPGCWFGCPAYAVGLVPVLAAAAAPQAVPFVSAAGGLAALGGGWWLWLCQDGRKGGAGILKAFTVLHRKGIAVLPHAAMAVAALGGQQGRSMAALYICSWHITQLTCEMGKNLFWRRRPAFALEEELKPVERALVMPIPSSQEYLSFPSGDTAGAAVFLSTHYLMAEQHLGLASTALGCAAFGRLYFHYHHLLDVIVGGLTGLTVTVAIHRTGRPTWGHVLGAQFCLFALWRQAQKLKPASDGMHRELDSGEVLLGQSEGP